MFISGKYAYCIVSAGSTAYPGALTNATNVDASGELVPIVSSGINGGLTVSYAKWECKQATELIKRNTFNSLGHNQYVPGFDGAEIKLSGPMNLGEHLLLSTGLLVTVKLGLAGPAASAVNNVAAIPPTVFLSIPCFVEDITPSADAEAGEDISLTLKSNGAANLVFPA